MFKDLSPILWTSHIEETITFYKEILDFTVLEYNKEWQWAALKKDNTHIMLSKPNAHLNFKTPNFTGSLYFNVTDVESLYSKLKNKVKICYPISTFEWKMKEFAIYDNNGYILQFGQILQ